MWASNLSLLSFYIILPQSKLQYLIEVIRTGLWTIGQCDSPTFLAGFPLLWTPGELHDKQDEQFLIGQNHTFMVDPGESREFG